MSVSAIFGTRLAAVMPRPSISPSPQNNSGSPSRISVSPTGNGETGMVIECSSRPQKKATAHHRKTRPKKTQPWDVRRGPAVYPPLPPLPPDWTLVEAAAAPAEVSPTPTQPE